MQVILQGPLYAADGRLYAAGVEHSFPDEWTLPKTASIVLEDGTEIPAWELNDDGEWEAVTPAQVKRKNTAARKAAKEAEDPPPEEPPPAEE